MKRTFESTIIWDEVGYFKDVEIEVTEEENGVIDDLWKDSRDCWNKIIAAAYKAKDGLLILNVSNMKFFEHCWWHIKQLAKQEADLHASNAEN